MADTDLLTVKQAADRLGISTDRTYRRIRNGALPTACDHDRDGHYLIAVDAIEAYIAAGCPLFGPGVSSMIRVSVAARLLGYSVETVRKLCAEGKLKFVRGSGERGHRRISRDSVEDYLATFE